MLVCGVSLAQPTGLEVGGHVKGRLRSTTFPDDSFFRGLSGSSAEDLGLDARLSLDWRGGGWQLQADAELGAFRGDAIEFTRAFEDELEILFPRLPDDGRRLFDLTHRVTDRGKRAAVARLDRLSAGFTGRNGVLRFGRQAVTWGNGLIFNTVTDIFNPFDPTAIDTEYKSGDDMLYGQYLRAGGDDVEGVVVFRRDPMTGSLTAANGSFAVKYHGLRGAAEFDLVIARHFDDALLGFGGNRSFGGALWSGDLMVTFADGGGSVVSAVTSLSRSFSWAGRNVSAVVEYYFNGFGQRDGRYGPSDLASNPKLTERLARGEVFNVGRHFLGLSALIEITPLLSLTPMLFANLEDGSALVQMTTRADLGESLLLLGALNVPLGEDRTEYGGIDSGVPGRPLSSGPGVFLQLAWYF